MTYTRLTTTGAVNAYFKYTFTTTSKPSTSEIEGWIDEATAIIYSSLATIYAVPVTDADDLIILRNLANMYVRAEIQFAQSRGTNTTAQGRFNVPKKVDHSKFYMLLDRLVSGEMTLPNTSNASSYALSYSYTEDNDVEFVADKDSDQW